MDRNCAVVAIVRVCVTVFEGLKEVENYGDRCHYMVSSNRTQLLPVSIRLLSAQVPVEGSKIGIVVTFA